MRYQALRIVGALFTLHWVGTARDRAGLVLAFGLYSCSRGTTGEPSAECRGLSVSPGGRMFFGADTRVIFALYLVVRFSARWS